MSTDDPETADGGASRAALGSLEVASLPIAALDGDETFRTRPEGDISLLATDLARLGQLFPIDVRARDNDRYQVISGFRRVSALKFIQRNEVMARIYRNLSDDDALLMALASTIHATPASLDDLRKLRAELEGRGMLNPAARDMLDKALSVGEILSPESVEEEIDADDLSEEVTLRLAEINQDLSLLADVFDDLEPEHQQELLRQLRYSAELVAFLESES